ncbi:3-keto-5-aminohexanoate cleavage protein [Pseudomonas sp. SWRI59]|uniref:3-keto-5-aminohexanoate cleavage protein n=1 Tax=Pseudomonas TaxID=286 RepID=UPI001648454E|nr:MULTISPECIES: 3-keto-5-aminohexanoate cleavage protein [unclassified Pseudomonas]MBC3504834.1 3-keto-5-aminohexanoate cleavage protein [Pseudomonas sp. SWRI59]MBC3510064.1 3-keto-5-aminohexanoate cleavage protein [Pseudomonas sp. SWRI68]
MNNKNRKIIITCAVTGAMHTPTMSEHLPITPDQIAQQAIEAVEAGASIVHLHARNPIDGRPSPDPALFDEFVPEIARKTGAVINITTGGSTRMTLEERLAYPLRARPEMCSLNMGSMNFSIHPIARKIDNWQHEWERPYVEGMEDLIFRNTFKDIKHIMQDLGESGTRFELECYDVGHLYNLAYFVDEGLIKPPFFIQSIYGILGGLGPDPENLSMMRGVADRLFGRANYEFSILGAGRHQMSLLTIGAIMGGHVRVGLEDSIYLGKGVKAKSNAEQVKKIRRILEELSYEIATPDEARQILGLKGANNVGF